ncbi:DUF3530 family protein [Gayadomonas joobiniege]|uniref:DUF3530 family protein n=1 Tax=Gayadomonas joobiniege TaxID=1234606 RepID=UPI00036CE67F|nr:DUF3530 family protein [Gayadomonas joobiniege]
MLKLALYWVIIFYSLVASSATDSRLWPANPVQLYQSDMAKYGTAETLKYVKLNEQDYPIWFALHQSTQHKANLILLLDTSEYPTVELPTMMIDLLNQDGIQVISLPVPAYAYTHLQNNDKQTDVKQNIEDQKTIAEKQRMFYLKQLSELIKQASAQFSQPKDLLIAAVGKSADYLTQITAEKMVQRYRLMIWWQADLSKQTLDEHIQSLDLPVLDLLTESFAVDTPSVPHNQQAEIRAQQFLRLNNPYYRQQNSFSPAVKMQQQQAAKQILGYLKSLNN